MREEHLTRTVELRVSNNSLQQAALTSCGWVVDHCLLQIQLLGKVWRYAVSKQRYWECAEDESMKVPYRSVGSKRGCCTVANNKCR